MKKILPIIIAIIPITAFLVWRSRIVRAPLIESSSPGENQPAFFQDTQNQIALTPSENIFQMPLPRATKRITKKPFSILITPQNSPVQPERFSGYHTGTDFEIFPEEQDSDVPVSAIISGKIIMEKWVSGYGGVLVESATIDDKPVTIIYGHLNLKSINKKIGDDISAGEQIGILGKGQSQETDGERKHLHLGIHRGSGINILGYVQNKKDLENWIDPMSVL